MDRKKSCRTGAVQAMDQGCDAGLVQVPNIGRCLPRLLLRFMIVLTAHGQKNLRRLRKAGKPWQGKFHMPLPRPLGSCPSISI